MIALVFSFLTVLASLVGMVARPISARCPAPLWLATGVQPDGRFGCWLVAPLSESDTPDTRSDESTYRGVVWLRVWCSGDEQPRQDGVRVWCARGGAGS